MTFRQRQALRRIRDGKMANIPYASPVYNDLWRAGFADWIRGSEESGLYTLVLTAAGMRELGETPGPRA